MRTAIRHFIEAGGVVYAECGGFDVLDGDINQLRGAAISDDRCLSV